VLIAIKIFVIIIHICTHGADMTRVIPLGEGANHKSQSGSHHRQNAGTICD
jgi:hypothetical protein